VLLGFLGNKHDKDRTRYVLSKAPGDEGEERSWETEMITEALCRFFAPDETVLFLTKKAREVWEEDIATRLASWNPCIVDIPDGQSEEEMYDIMAAVVEALPEEGTALLDITHGFRSLPVLMLFAVFYAMAVKKTDVESILYGVFRFGGTEEEKATTPVLRMDLLLYLTRLAQGFRTFLDAGILPSAAVDLAKRKWKSPLVGKATDSIAGMGSALRTGLIPLLHRRMGDLDRALPEMKNLPRLERLLFETVACSYRMHSFRSPPRRNRREKELPARRNGRPSGLSPGLWPPRGLPVRRSRSSTGKSSSGNWPSPPGIWTTTCCLRRRPCSARRG
jgi:CRISPR-associated DxTHG motif protein